MDALEENETKYKKQVVVLPMRISKLQKEKVRPRTLKT